MIWPGLALEYRFPGGGHGIPRWRREKGDGGDRGGGGEQSALVNELLGLLSGGGQGGGLQGLIQTFQDKGLGDIMSS